MRSSDAFYVSVCVCVCAKPGGGGGAGEVEGICEWPLGIVM